MLRNSFVVATEKQMEKVEKLHLTWSELFLPQQELIHQKTKELSILKIDFSEQKKVLNKQFSELLKLAQQTDQTFLGAVKAQEAKQIKGLENLEKRLLKAEKRVHNEKLERITAIQNQLFSNGSLQERKSNFSELYSKEFIKTVISLSNPLKTEFKIIKI